MSVSAHADDDREVIERRYEYDDREVLALAVPAPDEDVAVDLLEGTAIVVVEDGAGGGEFEYELPEGDAQAVMNNGIVTIEVSR